MNLDQYTEYSPCFALMRNKDGNTKDLMASRFVALPEQTRLFLADESTAQRVIDITKQVGIDSKFGVAIAKLIGLRVLGDVEAPTVSTLLERVGVEKANSQSISASIETLIASIPKPSAEDASQAPAPVATDSARPPTPYKPLDMASRQLPPLTQQIPEADSAPVPQRNIIDLRHKPPGTTT